MARDTAASMRQYRVDYKGRDSISVTFPKPLLELQRLQMNVGRLSPLGDVEMAQWVKGAYHQV